MSSGPAEKQRERTLSGNARKDAIERDLFQRRHELVGCVTSVA